MSDLKVEKRNTRIKRRTGVVGVDDVDLMLMQRKVHVNVTVPEVENILGKRLRHVLISEMDFKHLLAEVKGLYTNKVFTMKLILRNV